MAAYEHVVVVMSIVLGLAVTQLLKGIAQLYQRRAAVRTYWLHTAWAVLLVLFSFLLWWTFWNYRGIEEWDFLRFVIYLSPTIAFYFLTSMTFPDPAEKVTDLRQHYFANRSGFFGAFAVYGVLAGLTAVVIRRLPVLDPSKHLPAAAGRRVGRCDAQRERACSCGRVHRFRDADARVRSALPFPSGLRSRPGVASFVSNPASQRLECFAWSLPEAGQAQGTLPTIVLHDSAAAVPGWMRTEIRGTRIGVGGWQPARARGRERAACRATGPA